MKVPIEEPEKSTRQTDQLKRDQCDKCFKLFKNRHSLSTHQYRCKSRKVPVAVESDVLQPDRMSQQVDGIDKNGFQKTEELDMKNVL